MRIRRSRSQPVSCRSRLLASAVGRIRFEWTISSAWFAREERIAVDLELPRFLLATGTLEGVDGLPNPDVDEAAILQHFLPGCARQTTGDSSGPKINVADRRLGHRLAIRDIRELKPSARAEDTVDF